MGYGFCCLLRMILGGKSDRLPIWIGKEITNRVGSIPSSNISSCNPHRSSTSLILLLFRVPAVIIAR